MNLLSKYSLIAAFAVAGFSGAAIAEENETANKSKLELEKMHKDAKTAAGSAATGEQDADDLITNAKLRAESGSKSKYSISVNMNYSGSTLEKPLDKNRPNITQGAALTNYSSIDGTVAAKMNVTKTDSLSLGIGIRAVTPFSKNTPEGAGQRLNASDPSLMYQKLSKIGGVQSVTVVGPTFFTSKDVRDTGTMGDLTLQQILAYDFNGSRFTLGGLAQVSARAFDKGVNSVCGVDADTGDNVLCGGSQSDYTAGLYPFAEFQISDALSLRTITGLYVYDHQRPEDRFLTFKKNTIYQSVGLGISVTRDIYVYPNIQFVPEYMRADRTNVALNTTFNLF